MHSFITHCLVLYAHILQFPPKNEKKKNRSISMDKRPRAETMRKYLFVSGNETDCLFCFTSIAWTHKHECTLLISHGKREREQEGEKY